MLQSLTNDHIVFATAGYDHTIRFWKPHTGVNYRTAQHNDSQINCMAIFPDKSCLAVGGYQHVSIYDTMSNNPHAICSLEGTTKNTVAIGFQEEGKWMYTAGEDKTLRIWDMRSYSSRHVNCSQIFNHNQPITSAVLHPNQVDFFIGDEAGNLIKWDMRNHQREQIIQEPKVNAAIRSIAVNQDGTLLTAVNNEGSCWIWTLRGGFGDADTGYLLREAVHQPHTRYALKCIFSPDSTLLATSSADGTAKIWRTVDFSLHIECKDNHQKWVWDLAFTNDSQYLFTASSDNMARLWSVQTGEIKKDYIGHQKPCVCLAFSDSR